MGNAILYGFLNIHLKLCGGAVMRLLGEWWSFPFKMIKYHFEKWEIEMSNKYHISCDFPHLCAYPI
jgi:hypothetical protein